MTEYAHVTDDELRSLGVDEKRIRAISFCSESQRRSVKREALESLMAAPSGR